jgi:hypothetical protein
MALKGEARAAHQIELRVRKAQLCSCRERTFRAVRHHALLTVGIGERANRRLHLSGDHAAKTDAC